MLNTELTKDWLDFPQFRKRYEKANVLEHPNFVSNALPKPALSVVLVTYQHVDFIESAVKSILMQRTTFPFELIIGDDDSDDGTREICLNYAKRFPSIIRLFLHHRDNNIEVLGRPTGIFQIAYNLFQCRGKYIVLTSGDDYWSGTEKLQKQIDYLEEHSDVSYVYHDHVRLFTDTGELKGPYPAKRIQTVMGRNIFEKLPKEFLGVMQEDSFMKFFWSQVGQAVYQANVEPAVVRFHSASMYTSLNEPTVYSLRKHLWRKIVEASTGFSRVRRKAELELAKVIFYKPSLEQKTSKLARIISTVKEWHNENVFMSGIALIFSASFKKLIRRT